MILNHTFRLFIFLTFLTLAVSCDKEESYQYDTEAATIYNYTGLDGCSWIIQLDSGEKLEPSNLYEFGISIYDGKKVWISYSEESGYASICMIGPIVRIHSMWDR